MLKIKCIKKCIYKGRVYKPGQETRILFSGVFPEKCFIFKVRTPVKIKLPIKSGSITLLGDGPSLQYTIDNPDLINTPVAVVNRAGVKYPGKIDYWFSLHPQFFALWKNRRRKAGWDVKDIKFISNRVPLNPDVIRSPNYLYAGGGSGLYALQTLEIMGFDHAHIIGMDLTGDKHEIFRPAFKPDDFKIKITAHQGFLKELFN